MKLSKYTVFINEENGILMYNTVSDGILQLDECLVELVQTHKDRMEMIENIHPDLYKTLDSKRFIVQDSIDEVQLLLEKWSAALDNPEQFRLTVNPTLNCNLRCWYCYENHNGNKRMTPNVLEALKLFIKRKLHQSRIKLFLLDFFGGEPLLMFDEIVYPLMQEAYHICASRGIEFHSSFTTNGVLLEQEKLHRLKQFNDPNHPIGFQITFDGNQDYHDRVRCKAGGIGTFDTIMENIKVATKMGYEVNVRCNYTNDNIDSFVDLISYFRKFDENQKKHLFMDFHQVWQDTFSEKTKLKSYKIQDDFRNIGVSVAIENRLGKSFCYADKETALVVNYDGQVFNCTAREFLPERSEGFLDDGGEIVYNERHIKRMNLRWGGTTCKECVIYPICHGGCSQDKLEASDINDCIRGYTDVHKMEIVRGRVFHLLQSCLKERG